MKAIFNDVAALTAAYKQLARVTKSKVVMISAQEGGDVQLYASEDTIWAVAVVSADVKESGVATVGKLGALEYMRGKVTLSTSGNRLKVVGSDKWSTQTMAELPNVINEPSGDAFTVSGLGRVTYIAGQTNVKYVYDNVYFKGRRAYVINWEAPSFASIPVEYDGEYIAIDLTLARTLGNDMAEITVGERSAWATVGTLTIERPRGITDGMSPMINRAEEICRHVLEIADTGHGVVFSIDTKEFERVLRLMSAASAGDARGDDRVLLTYNGDNKLTVSTVGSTSEANAVIDTDGGSGYKFMYVVSPAQVLQSLRFMDDETTVVATNALYLVADDKSIHSRGFFMYDGVEAFVETP